MFVFSPSLSSLPSFLPSLKHLLCLFQALPPPLSLSDSGEMDLELRGRALSAMGGSGRLWLQGRVGGGQCSVVVKIMEFLGSTSGKSGTFPIYVKNTHLVRGVGSIS